MTTPVSAHRVRTFALHTWAIRLVVAAPVALWAALPVGGEFAINSYTPSNQNTMAISS